MPHAEIVRQLVAELERVGVDPDQMVAGLTVAWQGYGVDDRAGHIYSLSLPVTRTRALALRAASAAVICPFRSIRSTPTPV